MKNERLLEVTLTVDGFDNDVCEVGIHDAETGDWVHKSFVFPKSKDEYCDWIGKFGEWVSEEIYGWFEIMKEE